MINDITNNTKVEKLYFLLQANIIDNNFLEFRKTIDKLQEDKLWNPNYDYGNGYNLVHAAVEYAPKDTKSDILEFLLQDGANIDALYKGKNPLSIARSNNKINLVNQILHFQSSNEETKLDNTDFDGTISNNIPSDYEIKELYFLFLAEIKNNDLTGVKKILNTLKSTGNWNQDYIYDKELTLVYAAVEAAPKGAKSDILEFLLLNGSRANHPVNKKTPLYLAACDGKFDIVEQILTLAPGIDINRSKITPLSIAKQNNHHEIVNLLRSFGAEESPSDTKAEELYSSLLSSFKNMNLEETKKIIDKLDVNKLQNSESMLEIISANQLVCIKDCNK